MSIFKKIAESNIYGFSKYVHPGMYMAKVREVKLITSGQRGCQYFIVEVEVLDYVPDTDEHQNTKAGDVIAWRVGDDQPSFFSNVKQFAFTVAQALTVQAGGDIDSITDDVVSEEMVEELVGKDNPAADLVLEIRATGIRTRKDKPFTKVIWAVPS